MRKGKRLRDDSQRCLTNPGVLALVVEGVRGALWEVPDATIVSVSQNDNWNYCECPGCRAVDEAEGSHAGTMIRFVNAVAQAIEPEFPHVAVDTLAYMYTRTPPKRVRPRSNVIVRLCPFECCFAHPLELCTDDSNTLWVKEAESNSSFMRDLDGWGRLTERLYIWSYATNFMHYPLQFPNLDALEGNMRTYAQCGVAGVMECGNTSTGSASELGELKSWVIARLLVDPSLRVDDLVAEFVEGVFGAAAEPVKRYIALARRVARESGDHVRIYDGAEKAYLAPGHLAACDGVLGEARRLASGDPALEKRVARLSISVWYAMVEGAGAPAEMRKGAAKRLLEAARQCGVVRMSALRGMKTEEKRLEGMAGR